MEDTMKNRLLTILGTFLLGAAHAGALDDKRAWSRISDPLILDANERNGGFDIGITTLTLREMDVVQIHLAYIE